MTSAFRLVVVLAALISTSTVASGEDDGALRSEIASVEAALATEQAALDGAVRRFESDKAKKARELEELRARRDRASRRLARLRTSPEEASAESAAPELQKPVLSPEKRAELEGGIDRVVNAATIAAEQLKLYLGELPGADAEAERLSKLIPKLGSGKRDQQAAALSDILILADDIHEQAGRVRATSTSIWTARGKRETATLLSIGHAAFAYVAADGDRSGVALSSPAEASGHRWSEELSPETEQAVRTAIARMGAGQAGLVDVPMDVSRQIRRDTIASPLSPGELFEAGGYVMYPLGLVGLVALLLVLERAFVFYRLNRAGGQLPNEVVERCRRGDFSDAEALCTRTRGAVGRTLAALIKARARGRTAMEDTVQEQLLHELPRLEQRMGGIAILAAVAPLLGLLGTVTGIIQTFRIVHSFGNANPGLLAGGISEALTTTAAGLCIAIPVFLIHSVLRGRLDKILSDAERQAASVLNVIAHEGAP